MKHHIRFTAHAAVVLTAVTSIALLSSVALMGSAAEEDEHVELGLQFYAAPLQVVKGEKIRLDWESEDADYCTASGSWTGKKEPAGSVRIAGKKKTEVFILQCFDEEGNASKKITQKVTVVTNKKQLKRKKLEAPKVLMNGPAYATGGRDAVISWGSSKGVVGCRASGPEDWEGLKPPGGNDTVEAAIGSEYRLSCWNENGQESKSATFSIKAKPNKYTATSAGVGLSAEYVPMYPDDTETSALAEGNGVYFIDFVKKKENGPTLMDDEYYWGKRIVLNIYTNLIIEDKGILEEVFAAPGQVPPDVDPITKRINAKKNVGEHTNNDLWRFINWGDEDTLYGEIPTFSPEEYGRLAVDYTLEYLQLPLNDGYQKLYTPSPVVFWYNGAVAGPPMFTVVDVYNDSDENIRRVVMNAYTGEDMTDKHIFDGEGFNGVIWDRTIMKERDAAESSVVTPPSSGTDPVSNPPEQKFVAPITEVKKEESKKEEQKTSTSCEAGYTYSPTLGCYKDISSEKEEKKQETTSQTTCPEGYSYSATFKNCYK